MSVRGTVVPMAPCSCAVRGRATPAAFQADRVRPGASYESGPAAPQTHGLPICARAKASACAAFVSYPDPGTAPIPRGISPPVVPAKASGATETSAPGNASGNAWGNASENASGEAKVPVEANVSAVVNVSAVRKASAAGAPVIVS